VRGACEESRPEIKEKRRATARASHRNPKRAGLKVTKMTKERYSRETERRKKERQERVPRYM
jgi:hypothetical protein